LNNQIQKQQHDEQDSDHKKGKARNLKLLENETAKGIEQCISG
jgi:hypothetical protein